MSFVLFPEVRHGRARPCDDIIKLSSLYSSFTSWATVARPFADVRVVFVNATQDLG
jgi:hypothetical protein